MSVIDSNATAYHAAFPTTVLLAILAKGAWSLMGLWSSLGLNCRLLPAGLVDRQMQVLELGKQRMRALTPEFLYASKGLVEDATELTGWSAPGCALRSCRRVGLGTGAHHLVLNESEAPHNPIGFSATRFIASDLFRKYIEAWSEPRFRTCYCR